MSEADRWRVAVTHWVMSYDTLIGTSKQSAAALRRDTAAELVVPILRIADRVGWDVMKLEGTFPHD